MDVRRFVVVCLVLATGLAGGCSEFVLEGIVSDRETARPISDVSISQRCAETWKELGETDGRGRYWILKTDVRGGGKIRLAKPGYRPTELLESEFMTGQSFILVPTSEAPDEMSEAAGASGD